ncbi:MAG: topoisomerase [Actinomycetota bacterium]|jgi:DNA topoisomerase IB|nr:topoisomerase [Actinomycetota bacterium]
MPRLRRSDCHSPGIRRRRAGRGFFYVGPDDRRITDREVIERINALAIPPAWDDVWICPWPHGHIQATGVDARGRRQYRYHDVWRLHRDREKFDHMLEFAACLPSMRARCRRDLAAADLSREQVLACATRLLDVGFFRIGTEGYAEQNQTYGLATIRKDHVTVRADQTLEFDYVAKSGKQRIQSVVDPEVHAVVAALKRRRAGGPELLAWREGRRWVDVRSDDINAYVKEITGGDFTAKDFRTWHATTLAAVALAVSVNVVSPTGRKRAIARACKEVSGYLGNTPAVCRSSYIDPRVIDRFHEGETVAPVLARLGADVPAGSLATHGEVEAAVAELLADGDAAASQAA